MVSAFDLLMALINAVTLFGAIIIPLYTISHAYSDRVHRGKWICVIGIECILALSWFLLPDEATITSFKILYIFFVEGIAIGIILLVPQSDTNKHDATNHF
mgnify:CR=1 FL=1